MPNTKFIHIICLSFLLIGLASCSETTQKKESEKREPSTPENTDLKVNLQNNVLDYVGVPDSASDRSSLSFSDQGAWFSYGFSDRTELQGGFSGPFLMTQDNGAWISPMLSSLTLQQGEKRLRWNDFNIDQNSYPSHLEQVYENDELRVEQALFFSSGHSSIIRTQITNKSDKDISLSPTWNGDSFLESVKFEVDLRGIKIVSENSPATGYIQIPEQFIDQIQLSDSDYEIRLKEIELQPGQTHEFAISHSFIFPEYDWSAEKENLSAIYTSPKVELQKHIEQKRREQEQMVSQLDSAFPDSIYHNLLGKSLLTLQNNWRIPAGELKYSGLFPSYHYIWFHGFWAWDSWKHAAALAHYNPELAKDQIRAMYSFQEEDGFIPDCIYRDTSIEQHNYRNTKPPLSAWAVWKVYERDGKTDFIEEMLPKIVKQHTWWYQFRDHDHDGICEYGSTDGTLIAAKWESGMDNAVRFDNSQILKNTDKAYSLNQESVDLNAYLYAEKIYLSKMAELLNEDASHFTNEAKVLLSKIQEQFFHAETGWFYDTDLTGENHILAMGCEGWIPLWANAAAPEQAELVKQNMMDSLKFNTTVPFQTLSADHPKFEPDGGYWRGPNWLDQAYFGVRGLHNYGYHEDALTATHKLIHNPESLLKKGTSIRENYQPLSGKGLESRNFSWSAAHYILLLINE